MYGCHDHPRLFLDPPYPPKSECGCRTEYPTVNHSDMLAHRQHAVRQSPVMSDNRLYYFAATCRQSAVADNVAGAGLEGLVWLGARAA